MGGVHGSGVAVVVPGGTPTRILGGGGGLKVPPLQVVSLQVVSGK